MEAVRNDVEAATAILRLNILCSVMVKSNDLAYPKHNDTEAVHNDVEAAT